MAGLARPRMIADPATAAWPLDRSVNWRTQRQIRLGPVRIELRSNEPDFAGLRFFADVAAPGGGAQPASDAADFTLSLCNIKLDGPWPIERLGALHDRSYRGRKMVAGYYLTDHFGHPAYLISRGPHYWIFAQDFEPILWPYAVKHLLTVFALRHHLLHLKAAAIALDGRGALLIGRGGSGKTVLLSQLCRAGAQFLSNTHALIDGERNVLGIATSMRVRRDAIFGPMIDRRGLRPSVKLDEYVANPLADLGWQAVGAAPVRTICLLDYKRAGAQIIRELPGDTLFDYLEQFGLAINVYGLKEDILDALDGAVEAFSIEMSRVRARLRELVTSSRCYYLSCDAGDPHNLSRIRELLSR